MEIGKYGDWEIKDWEILRLGDFGQGRAGQGTAEHGRAGQRLGNLETSEQESCIPLTKTKTVDQVPGRHPKHLSRDLEILISKSSRMFTKQSQRRQTKRQEGLRNNLLEIWRFESQNMILF